MTFEEASAYWVNPPRVSAPVFPILHYEHFPPNEFFIKFGLGDAVGDPDYCGYKWDEYSRFIDSLGRVFKCSFLNYQKSIYGLVYPDEIEKNLSIEEVKTIVLNVLNVQISDNNKQYHHLIEQIKNYNFINEIFFLLFDNYEE